MLGVIQGFTVIGVIIGVGVLLGKTGWLGPHAPGVLTKLAFWVATPSLLFTVLADADLATLVSAQFIVSTIVMLSMALLVAVIAAVFRWGIRDGAVAALSSSYVNAGNLGIPIAVYVLGDATLVVPVMLAQLLLMAPVFTTILDVAAARSLGTRLRWWRIALRPFQNPIVIGALLGALVSLIGLPIPEFVFEPLALIGGMTVPAVLLAFGISMLDNAVPLRGPERGRVLIATVVKMVVHPIVAWLVAAYAFGLDGAQLLAVVVTAALPTAQNVFTYASQYGTAVRLARETVLVTTVLSVPAILIVTILVHP
ncbi:membrane protein [Pseudoclavibacter endophyticus]|uniref:AEC family transporter n=1 Tax=Pseudoclavibacter endophyticus TaxID=1778590 RepID=A0A6H9WJ72_9MICO|nr:AEC family transporter [Pseudoclavibacter endophyticus]KAB1646863.1 AEC family transporter [Pseudoclavibacter endophyticus]GGA74910.1 membrane protein [Pseudoclavibacter endophyticus]